MMPYLFVGYIDGNICLVCRLNVIVCELYFIGHFVINDYFNDRHVVMFGFYDSRHSPDQTDG